MMSQQLLSRDTVQPIASDSETREEGSFEEQQMLQDQFAFHLSFRASH